MNKLELEELTKEELKLDEPLMYKVIMLNDDYTPMDFVVDILINFFNKSYDEAVDIMIRIHKSGKSVCGVYPFDIAEAKSTQVKKISRENGYPLRVTIEENN